MRQIAPASENNQTNSESLRIDKRFLSKDLVKSIFFMLSTDRKFPTKSQLEWPSNPRLCIWADFRLYRENRRQLVVQVHSQENIHISQIVSSLGAKHYLNLHVLPILILILKWFPPPPPPPPSISHGKSIKTHWENALLITGTQFR